MKAKRSSKRSSPSSAFVDTGTRIAMFRHHRHTVRVTKRSGLASFVLGPPLKTGDNWFFSPRPSESLDAAGVKIVSGPAEEDEGETPRPQGHDAGSQVEK